MIVCAQSSRARATKVSVITRVTDEGRGMCLVPARVYVCTCARTLTHPLIRRAEYIAGTGLEGSGILGLVNKVRARVVCVRPRPRLHLRAAPACVCACVRVCACAPACVRASCRISPRAKRRRAQPVSPRAARRPLAVLNLAPRSNTVCTWGIPYRAVRAVWDFLGRGNWNCR